MRASRWIWPAFLAILTLLPLCVVAAESPARADAGRLTLDMRGRVETAAESGRFRIERRAVDWDPHRTAIIVCDMWDRHWCQGATARVAEMVPRMNEVLAAARAKGVLVIHCPSDTMAFYKDAPQRKLAQQAPQVELKAMPAGWCPLAEGKEPPLPFDNARDRCDCMPQCPHGNPWRRQIATLEIADNDAITDNDEAFFLMRARGIENVIVMGVHANMCVLGRPFSIRRMCALGQNVVLVRDLTDSMHDSQSPPAGLNHFRATELVVEHIEKYWCPSIASTNLAGGPQFSFREDRRPNVVMLIGEDEYETADTLPAFAEAELEKRGLRVTAVHANPRDLNDFPGIEALKTADLMLVSVRRRTPPAAQLELVRQFVAAGKPVVGIRTASHAFSLRDGRQPPAGHAAWPEFDAQVLGGHYTGHHDNKPDGAQRTLIWRLPSAAGHPILEGVPDGEITVGSWLYKTSPLAKTTVPLLQGRVEGREPDEPVAWTNTTAQGGRVFYASLGHPSDFELPAFRRLLLGGIFWALGKPVPAAADEIAR